MRTNKFKETDYDLVVFGKKNCIVHYGINYDFFRTLSNNDKAEYINNILVGHRVPANPTAFFNLMRTAVSRVDWSKTNLMKLICHLEVLIIQNDFEYISESLSYLETIDKFSSNDKSQDEIIKMVKAKYPNNNVRWNWFYRGMFINVGDIVIKGLPGDTDCHAYKVKDIDKFGKAELVGVNSTSAKEMVNELFQISVKLPDFDDNDYLG